MIVYKVVTDKRRSVSSLVTESRLFRNYGKNKIVTAAEGTFGLFCFKSFSDAEDFSHIWNLFTPHLTVVITCRSIGRRCKTPKEVLNLEITKLNKKTALANNLGNDYDYYYPLEGTVCYKQLKVLT